MTSNTTHPATPVVPSDVVLEARSVSAGYGEVIVVRDIDLHLRAGEVVVLLGPNGAGKTTTMLTFAGELQAVSGDVLIDGRPTRSSLHARARNGLSFVSEERSVCMGLSAADNLRLGRCDKDAAVAIFPELGRLLGRRAGLLSGGEQQMLTLARALARRPRLLLADELSLGLAPLIVGRLLDAVRTAADAGLAVLLVEQHVAHALKVADRVYVMRQGMIEYLGTAAEAQRNRAEIENAYLAGSSSVRNDGARAIDPRSHTM